MLASTLAKIAAACVGAAAFHLQPLPRDLGAPTQQRLAYLGDTGMTVSWNTYEALAAPSVRYGLAADALTEVAHLAESVTYQTSTTWSNHVELTGLLPATTYYYQVQNDANVYSFTTAKPAGATDAFSFGVVIDMGTMGELGLSDKGAKGEAGVLAKGERNTVEALAALLSEYDFLWHPGDIAYADYWLKEEYQGYLPNLTISDGYKVYEQILNAFYNQIQPVSSLKPYMVGPGNHEADCDNGGYKTWTNLICLPGQTNFEGFNSHWRMPSALLGGTKNMWYSFDYGLVHYVQFDTETDFPSGLSGPELKAPNGNFAATNAQLDWLRRDLALVNRTRTPWVIAAGHRPWYVAGLGCKDCQTAFEATLVEFGVDVVVAGHVHNYERIGPIGLGAKIDPNGLANPLAPWYILNGIGGHYDGVDVRLPVAALRPVRPGLRLRVAALHGAQLLPPYPRVCGAEQRHRARPPDAFQGQEVWREPTQSGRQHPRQQPGQPGQPDRPCQPVDRSLDSVFVGLRGFSGPGLGQLKRHALLWGPTPLRDLPHTHRAQSHRPFRHIVRRWTLQGGADLGSSSHRD